MAVTPRPTRFVQPAPPLGCPLPALPLDLEPLTDDERVWALGLIASGAPRAILEPFHEVCRARERSSSAREGC